MKIMKDLARRILQDEIAELKDKADKFEQKSTELSRELSGIESKYESQIFSLNQAKEQSESKSAEWEKENTFLRKYYDLDKEPTDEIKAKIHIDLEINRLKEENMKLMSMLAACYPSYIPRPYPVYPPIGRGFI